MDIVDSSKGNKIKKESKAKRFFSKLSRGLKKVSSLIVGRTIPQRLFRLYVVTVFIGALLLAAPFCLQVVDGVQLNGYTNAGGNYNFLKALFIACSGFSDTGLTPVNIYQYLNVGGQVVLAILIEIGGIGIVALFYYIWYFFSRKDTKVDVRRLYIMQAERGGAKLEDAYRVIRKAVTFILIIQIIFMFAYSLCFYLMPSFKQEFKLIANDPTHACIGISWDSKESLGLQGNYGKSLWTGFFTTISAMNNAGFDNISSTSMAPFRNDWGLILQALIVIELIIGGLGHFVWFDIIEKIHWNNRGVHYTMSLYSKVAITVYIIVAVIAVAAMLGCEFSNADAKSEFLYSGLKYEDPSQIDAVPLKEITIIGNTNSHGEFGQHEWLNKYMSIIFGSFNTRSLGMETVKTDFFARGTKWVMSGLMFIGASPCSTAGGIRTTTLAVIFITIWSKLLGRKNIFFFKKRISDETVLQAFMIFTISFVLILIGIPFLASATHCPDGINTQQWFRTSDYVVELCSAFGTVGLSTGVTSVCKWWGMLYLILLMFVGQLGVINTLLSWTKFHPHFNDVQYPYEDIKIG